MDPLISIIVPIYKVEKYLEKCIGTIMDQTYKNIEIILVDDGSPDNSPQICDEYAKKDSRIIVIHQKNGGLSNARNSALNIAKGEYIGFVDGDDYIANDMYETLYNAIKENNAQMAICRAFNVNENGELMQDEIQPDIKEDIKVFTKYEAMKEMLFDKNIRGYVWSKLFKRDCFENLRFPEGRNYEDIAISIKCFEKTDRIVYVNKQIYYYVQRENSIDHVKSEKNLRDAIEVSYERYKYVKENYPELRKYNIYAFIHRILCAYKDLKKMNYMDVYYCKEYVNMIQELKEDYLELEVSIINYMNDEQKMQWYTLIYDMEVFKNI